MITTRTHRLWLVLAIIVSSVALGLGVTAILGASGAFNKLGPAAADGPYPNDSGVWQPGMMGSYPAAPLSCRAPALPGTVVDVTLADMGGMMGPGTMGPGGMMGPGAMGPGGMMGPGTMGPNGPGQNAYQWPHMGSMGMMGMMGIFVNPTAVPAGQVSFRVVNTGMLNHEMVVLPLVQGQFPGQRIVGSDGKVDEAGSLSEASRTCGPDKGDEQSGNSGIARGATGWSAVTLPPGRYELICNIAGHYGAGMYTELDVLDNP